MTNPNRTYQLAFQLIMNISQELRSYFIPRFNTSCVTTWIHRGVTQPPLNLVSKRAEILPETDCYTCLATLNMLSLYNNRDFRCSV